MRKKTAGPLFKTRMDLSWRMNLTKMIRRLKTLMLRIGLAILKDIAEADNLK
jgi:hypothetical protein